MISWLPKKQISMFLKFDLLIRAFLDFGKVEVSPFGLLIYGYYSNMIQKNWDNFQSFSKIKALFPPDVLLFLRKTGTVV